MDFLKVIIGGKKKKKITVDYYQESLNKVGKEQFSMLAKRGLGTRIVTNSYH